MFGEITTKTDRMKKLRIINFRVILLLLFILHINGVFSQNLSKEIDSLIIDEIKDEYGPGGVFMVAKNGKIIYEKAIGKANIELDENLTTNSVFQLGSMTKQFTAIAILILEEQGKLNTKDLVSKYIPDYPSGDSITLHHLLTHTSGIKDYTKLKTLRDVVLKEMTPKMLVDLFKNEPDDFQPGEKFEYNNSGYVLLGYIIEIISGLNYEEFIKKHIFEKAGMSNSRYASDRQIITNRAYGYQKRDSIYLNKTIINYSVPFASGALMSTMGDMLKWQDALNQNIILKNEYTQKAFETYSLNNGEKFTYGYGWHIKDVKGIPSREHGGSIFGFKTMGIYIPSEDIYVLGMCNCDCISPTQLVRDITELAIEEFRK